MLAALFDPFLTLIYPPRCVVCKMLGEAGLCAGCAEQIAPVSAPLCRICGQTIPADPDGCLHCRQRRPAFIRARALGAYDGVLRHAIHHFKYRDRPQMAVPLGRLLAAYARDHAQELNRLEFDAILPVPMHAIRQRIRGYNQSERLVRVLSGELGLPMLATALVRVRPTRPQVGLAGDARRTNLSGAFAVKEPENVTDKSLLLIDDVVTRVNLR